MGKGRYLKGLRWRYRGFIVTPGGSAFEGCYQEWASAGIDQAISMQFFAVGSRDASQLVHRATLQRTPEITVGTDTTGQDCARAVAGSARA